ncbi:protein ASPARTIC PROTEASE IN GUARD CELL 1 [Carica papaya]|uniref:protein ASPARTIC PROTEASE IN GUARD CELL 1 n=1 Tax=Carica papaya TaxID=3649 RepID=UPI000B8C8659|nr:protein ASPARTIC PROTEASE IN GUARD CELL 1 [Carica papaya]
MARNPYSLFPILFLSSLFIVSALSRSLSRTPYATTLLDVSSALKQSLDILSFDPENFKSEAVPQQQQETVVATPSSLSLELHSRDTLHKIQHEDYRSLVLSRLKRDSSRVAALNAKLELALNNVNKSELKPVGDTLFRPEDLSIPVVSGASQGSGEYFSRIGVGSPAKQFYMVLDTGSDVNWLQCEPCTDCYQQTDPIFNPSSSSSYSPLSCGSPQCGALDMSGCRSGSCIYQVSYGDGSFTVGEFVTEKLSFGNSGSIDRVALGCGHDNEGLFVGSAGLLGLGGGLLSLTSQIKASSFSYCLVDRDSGRSSSLDFNSVSGSDGATAPLLRNRRFDTFYYVGLTGFSVGGQMLSIPPSLFQVDESGNGGIIVDCGTAVTRLQTQAYNSLRDAFVSMARGLKSTGSVALFDTCYDFSSLTQVRVPTVSFHFSGGRSYDLPAKNYLIPVDSSGTFCFAFAPTSSSLSIIGNVQQQGTRVSYDLANNRVGFTPNKC